MGSINPIEPDELEDFEKQQAERIRKFLKRLGTNDKLLLRYINDRVAVLQDELKAKRLESEDVALLLESDYRHVYEVMSKGSAPQRWIVIWIV